MAKVVYNNCYGGFSLSRKALYWLAEHGCESAKAEIKDQEKGAAEPDTDGLAGWARKRWLATEDSGLMSYSWHPSDCELSRDNVLLVQCVEELGEAANGSCADLAIEEIPDGTQYRIDGYDGNERVMTRESYDWKTA